MMYRTLALVAIVAASSVSVEARLNASRGLQGKNNDKNNKEKNNDKDNKEKDNAAAAPVPTVPAPVFPAIPAGATEFRAISGNGCGDELCGNCEGDCDADEDCQAGLICMQRADDEVVPGCSGFAKSQWDYCYNPRAGISEDTPPAVPVTTTPISPPAGFTPVTTVPTQTAQPTGSGFFDGWGPAEFQAGYNGPMPTGSGGNVNGNPLWNSALLGFERETAMAQFVPQFQQGSYPRTTGPLRLRAVVNTDIMKAWVLFEQGEDKHKGTWTVYMHSVIPFLCPATGPGGAELMWSINERPIGGVLGQGPQASATVFEGNPDSWCVSTGGHYDPTLGCGGLSQFQNTRCPSVKTCDQNRDVTSCEMGDLTGKHGFLPIGQGTITQYEDEYITNIERLAGLSIGFKCPTGQPPIVACANLVPDAPPPGFAFPTGPSPGTGPPPGAEGGPPPGAQGGPPPGFNAGPPPGQTGAPPGFGQFNGGVGGRGAESF